MKPQTPDEWAKAIEALKSETPYEWATKKAIEALKSVCDEAGLPPAKPIRKAR